MSGLGNRSGFVSRSRHVRLTRRRFVASITVASGCVGFRVAAGDRPGPSEGDAPEGDASRFDAEPPVTALVRSPDGKRIVAGSQAGVTLYDVATLGVAKRIAVGMDQIHAMAFSPDGGRLAVAGGDAGEVGVVEWFDWESHERFGRFHGGSDSFYDVSVSSDGRRWALAGLDETAYVIDDAFETVSRYVQHSRSVLACRFLPGDTQIVTASRDQTLRVWVADDGQPVRTLHNHTADVFSLAVRPGGDGLPMVASASADRTVRLWHPTIGRMVRFARLPAVPLDVAWSPGGEELFAGCDDGRVRRIDPDTVKILDTTDAFAGRVYAVVAGHVDGSCVVGGTSGVRRIGAAVPDEGVE